MQPKFEVQLKIRKPVAEVFDAVVNPQNLSSYFTKTANGPLAEVATVILTFAEAPESPVGQAGDQERGIVFEWACRRGATTPGSDSVQPLAGGATMVQIRERAGGTPQATELYGNARAGALGGLKGYSHTINLRAAGPLSRRASE